MTESLFRTMGAFELPVPVATVVADVALTNTLDLFAAALNAELGATWSAAVAGTAMAGTTPVQSVLPMAPEPRTIKEWKAGFPLLSLARTGEVEWKEKHLGTDIQVQPWTLTYILAPMGTAHLHRFMGVLAYVPIIINATIENCGHPEYDSGAQQFSEFEEFKLTGSQSGQAQFAEDADGPLYAACSMTLESEELAGWVDGLYPDLEGATFNIGVGDATEILPDMIIVQEDS